MPPLKFLFIYSSISLGEPALSKSSFRRTELTFFAEESH